MSCFHAETRKGVSVHAVAAIRLLLLTGCRKGEILNLRWDHLDTCGQEMSRAMPSRWKYDRPMSRAAFEARFPDEASRARHLATKRWPDGFVCPACGHDRGWELKRRRASWECAACGKETSVTAGTIMHRSHLPLKTWLMAVHIVTSHSNGISALQFQAQLGLGSYKSAWLLLHKLRRAMVDPDRSLLEDLVEIDEATLPFRTVKDPTTGGQGRSRQGKMRIAGAVELSPEGEPRRIRLAPIGDFSARSLHAFVAGTSAPRPSTPCSASARASDPPTTATPSDNASDPGRPGASHRPPSDPPQLEPNTGPPACLTAIETNFPKSKSSRTSPGTVRKPCLERRKTINISCDRKQREKPYKKLGRPLGVIEQVANRRGISPNRLMMDTTLQTIEGGEWRRTQIGIRVARSCLLTAQAIVRDMVAARRGEVIEQIRRDISRMVPEKMVERAPPAA